MKPDILLLTTMYTAEYAGIIGKYDKWETTQSSDFIFF